MTDTNEAAGADALEPVPVGEAPVEAPQPQQPEPAPAPAPDAGGEADETPDADDGPPDPAGDKPKKKGGYQRQIEKLEREKSEERAKAQQLQHKLEEYERKHAPKAPADPGPEPKIEDYATLDEFRAADRNHAREQERWESHQQQEARTRAEAQAEQQRQHLAAVARFEEGEAQARARYPDYDAAVEPLHALIPDPARGYPGRPDLAAFLMRSERGQDLAYHLGKNQAVLSQIARLDPFDAVRELTRLEMRLASPPPAKTVTTAPPPPKPVGVSERAAATLADLAAPDDASAYIARMNKRAGKT